jgi:hypothetical protein
MVYEYIAYTWSIKELKKKILWMLVARVTTGRSILSYEVHMFLAQICKKIEYLVIVVESYIRSLSGDTSSCASLLLHEFHDVVRISSK